jgi:hypothetical protein
MALKTAHPWATLLVMSVSAPLAPPPAPGAARPSAPAAAVPTDLTRARWVEARVRELSKYTLFFYNLLLDRHLPDHYKEHAFGTLWYILEGGDLLPPEDEDLAGVDACAFAYRCMGELVGRLPQASLAVYEEVLHRDGIAIRELLPEGAANLGKFFMAVSTIYGSRIKKSVPVYKNAIETGYLVKLLRMFLEGFKPKPWSADRLARVEAFLEGFELRR